MKLQTLVMIQCNTILVTTYASNIYLYSLFKKKKKKKKKKRSSKKKATIWIPVGQETDSILAQTT